MNDTIRALSRLMSKRLTLRLRIAKINSDLAVVEAQIKRLADRLTETTVTDESAQSGLSPGLLAYTVRSDD